MCISINSSQEPLRKNCSENQLQLKPFKHPLEMGLKPIHEYHYTYTDYLQRCLSGRSGSIEQGEFDSLLVKQCIINVFKDAQNGEQFFCINDRSPFVARLRDKQIQWLSIDVVNEKPVKEVIDLIIKSGDHSLHINTGSHGGADGSCITDCPRLGDGMIINKTYKISDHPNTNLYPVPPGGEPRFPINANHVLIGWCFSYCTAKKIESLVKELGIFGSVPDFFCCDITKKPMKEPVRFEGTCGHIFEKDVINKKIQESNIGIDLKEKKVKCPVPGYMGLFSCDKDLKLVAMTIDSSLQKKIALYLREKKENESNKKEIKETREQIKEVRVENTGLNKINTEQKDELVILKEKDKIGTIRFNNLKDIKNEQKTLHQKIFPPTIKHQSTELKLVDNAKSIFGSTRYFEAGLDFSHNKDLELETLLKFLALKNSNIDVSISSKQTDEISKDLERIHLPKTPTIGTTPENSPDKDRAMKDFEIFQNDVGVSYEKIKKDLQDKYVDREAYIKVVGTASKLKAKANPKKLDKLESFVSRTPRSKSTTPIIQEIKSNSIYNYLPSFLGGK